MPESTDPQPPIDTNPVVEPGSTAQRRIEKRSAIIKLWLAGVLTFKFKDAPWQRAMYDFVRGCWGVSPFAMIVAHRRSRKTTTALIVALEECLKETNTTVAIVCKSKQQVREIVESLFAKVLEDCPKSCEPRLVKQDFIYYFDHNGSKIIIHAADGLNATKVRGHRYKLVLFTEAAYIPKVFKIARKIFSPTIRDMTGQFRGSILLETTVPDPEEVSAEDLAEFEKEMAAAEADERLFTLRLSENQYATPEFVSDCKSDFGGEDSDEYQREFECVLSGAAAARTAVPEFTKERAHEETTDTKTGRKLKPIVRDIERPRGVDRYAGLDPGGTHPTGLAWAWYFPPEDLLVVEDEEILRNPTSRGTSEKIKQHEGELYPDGTVGKLRRYSDNDNPTLLRDLREDKVVFLASDKDDKWGWLNKIRIAFRDGRIAIHPRCKRLVKVLMLARRSKNDRKGFEELDGELGHADLLDALIYIYRNLKREELPAELTTTQLQEKTNAPVKIVDKSALTRAEKGFAAGWRRRYVEQ